MRAGCAREPPSAGSPDRRDTSYPVAAGVAGPEAVVRIQHPLTLHVSPDSIVLALEIEFRDGLTSDDMEQAVERHESAIRGKPQIRQIFLEARIASGMERNTSRERPSEGVRHPVRVPPGIEPANSPDSAATRGS